MNRKKSTTSTTTPKKKTTKKSSTTRKKSTPKKTPNSTPIKTRSSRSRTLPKSPISETLKQSKIKDFFQPVSPSVGFSQSFSSSQLPQLQMKSEPKEKIPRKATKGPKVLAPIFSSIPTTATKRRISLRNREIKFEENGPQNGSDEHQVCGNQMDVEILEISDDSRDSIAEPLPKVSKRRRSKRFDNTECLQNLDQKMDGLTLNSPKNCKNTTLCSPKDNSSEAKLTLNNDSNVNKLSEKVMNDLEDDELTPVFRPVFKIPEIPKKSKKQNSKYFDNEKEKKMNYFLKNLNRIKRDKEILNIQSIEEMDIELTKEKSGETLIKSEFRIKPFKGIDIFSDDYIPKAVQNYLIEDNIENSNEMKFFKELSLNRLIPLIPILNKTLKECDRQQLVSHIIHLVSMEESLINCTQSEHKVIDLLSDNDFELYLSEVLKNFYQILNRISVNLRNRSDSDSNDNKNEFKLLLNVIKVISLIFNKNSFKIEAMDSVEEFTKILIICFALGLDYRIVKNIDQIIDLKNLIAVILNNLFIDELKAIPIIESLISFCTSDKMKSFQILSLFPLNIDFELKRKFCISVIQLFVTKNSNEFQQNLSGISDILEEINWKSITPEDIYVIIQMIGLSLDLPKDLIDNKQTIASILGVLENKINSCVPKEADFEFTEIHKLLMILRSKVNVSTKKL